MRSLRPRPATLGLFFLALGLALGHAWLATRAMRDKSTTADELAHLTGGYTFNHWNDYRFHPENGILPQRWEALPLSFARVHYPPFAPDAWGTSEVWLMGYRFFYQSGNEPGQMLAGARAMNSLFGAATVLLVFWWSRRLWGPAGALVSAVFCALCPTMLAHSGVATSDMCMTFFLLLAVGAYWHHLHDGGLAAGFVSAASFGLAAVAKHTSLLLLPMAGLMILVRLAEGGPLHLGRRAYATLPGKLGVVTLSLLLHGAAVGLFLWAFFGFRYTAFNPALPPGAFHYTWELMLSFGGLKARVIEWCRHWQLLPEGYLYGLAFVLKHAESRGAFLDGDYSIYGWVSFFPKAFLYKTPLSLLGGLAASAAVLGVRLRSVPVAQTARHFARVTPLLVLFTVYWIFSLTSHLNIGHRHILPTYPVLYIFAGSLGWAVERTLRRSRATGGAVALALAGLLAWHAAVAARIYPHFLAYFSPVVGGPAEGYRHLVDSSLDWGQDLPGLKRWLDEHRRPGEPLYLSYFGTGEPDYYGIDAVRFAMLPSFDQQRPWYWCEPGLYALSATMLQHVYTEQHATWTPEAERQYQELRLNDGNFRRLKSGAGTDATALAGLSRPEWDKAWTLFERLRFARLCQYLRARRPDAMIGYSILVFRLDQAELDAALNGDLSQLSHAIGQALAVPTRPLAPD